MMQNPGDYESILRHILQCLQCVISHERIGFVCSWFEAPTSVARHSPGEGLRTIYQIQIFVPHAKKLLRAL